MTKSSPAGRGRTRRAFDATFPFVGSTCALAVLVLFLEAVFLNSKDSLLSAMHIDAQLGLLARSLFLLFVPLIVFWLCLFALSLALDGWPRLLRTILWACAFLVSFAFVFSALFHVDTFVYTLLGWGVRNLPRLHGWVLAVLVIDLSVLLVVKKWRAMSEFFLQRKRASCAAVGIIVLIALLSGIPKGVAGLRESSATATKLPTEGLPNIILFSADGVDCRHLSFYGYEKNTSPNLERLRPCTIYERAYANAGNTRASTTSILTGRSPLTTKVITIGDILRAADAFHHLPGILDALGYHSFDFNDGLVASSRSNNLREAFDMENGHRPGLALNSALIRKVAHVYPVEVYLLSDAFGRFGAKLIHIAGLSRPQPVQKAKYIVSVRGPEQVAAIKEILRTDDGPLFIRVHMTETHPLVFGYGHFGVHRLDSTPYTPEKVREIQDLFDNSIALVDRFFGEIIDAMQSSGAWENSLVIYCTDHGPKHLVDSPADRVRYPLPLIVHLPGQTETVVVEKPVQYLDIAPSILAFLAQPIPDWMEGRAIFGKSMDSIDIPSGPLIASVTKQQRLLHAVVRDEGPGAGPPFFSIYQFSLIDDDINYIYSNMTCSGTLYDVGTDPYSQVEITRPDLVEKYHTMLREQVESRGVRVREDPVDAAGHS